MLSLLPLFAALDAPAEPPLLGRLFQARDDVHEMGRSELTAALLERGTSYSVQDSEDVLRIRLYQARAALLDSRSAHLAHAERVMNEATEHSTFEFLSGNTLDTILAARPRDESAVLAVPQLTPLASCGCLSRLTAAPRTSERASETLRAQWRAVARPKRSVALHTQDDNAIFADTLGRGLLSSLHMHTAIGALVGLYLTYAQPLGRILPSAAPCRNQGEWPGPARAAQAGRSSVQGLGTTCRW